MTDKHYDDIAREVRLIRCVKPPRSAKGRYWRWDVQPYRRLEGPHRDPVNGRRQHVGGKFGYTYTRFGALWQINRALKWIETWR